MAAWPDNDVHEECLETYSELVEQTRQIIKEEHGEHGLSDPDLVWEAAQSSGAYNGLTGPDEFLKMADVLVNEFGREIDWTSCVRRIKEYESPSGFSIYDYLPTGYARGASAEIILHAVTYEITGEGRS